MTGDDLKKLRTAAGLTQGQLAERLGMSLRSVQELEGGGSPIRELHRLALSAIGVGPPAAGDAEVTRAIAARRVLHWDRQIALARRSLAMIDDLRITHHERDVAQQLQDVTAERRAEILTNLEAYAAARAQWAALAGPAAAEG